MKAAFPVSQWVDEWLKDKYNVKVGWDAERLDHNRDTLTLKLPSTQ